MMERRAIVHLQSWRVRARRVPLADIVPDALRPSRSRPWTWPAGPLPHLLRTCAATILLVALAGCVGMSPRANDWKPVGVGSAVQVPQTPGPLLAGIAVPHDGSSGFRLLSKGVDGFLARAELIAGARRTLDLQYYVFHQDHTGKLLTLELLRAADRGVRIRILVDDGEILPGDMDIALLHAHPRIEVRVFNPLHYRGSSEFLRDAEFVAEASRLDYRMHNKMIIADSVVGMIGGRNIGDQYFQVDDSSQFGDDDLVVAGPILRNIAGVFEEFWGSRKSVSVGRLAPNDAPERALADYRTVLAAHRAALLASGTDYARRIGTPGPVAAIASGATPLVWASAQLVYDSPEKKLVEDGEVDGRLMHHKVTDAVAGTTTELLMVTPFLIPGDDGMQLLRALRQRGVHVRILTNSLESNPEPAAHSGYMHYRIPLLRAGCELFEVRALLGRANGSGESTAKIRNGTYGLHAKLYVFDRRRLYIGSMNFDKRSQHLNTEIGLIIDSPELAAQTAARFEALVVPQNAYAPRLRDGAAGSSNALAWYTREQGVDVVYNDEPARSSWQRLKVRLLSAVPLDGEL